ncbi:MAG: ABC-type phosphate transport system, periplasmic component [Holophagaceae bacterium]|nr:ABC-type phosphate transport system, periplasmic component [Holophagaceae bacterium]
MRANGLFGILLAGTLGMAAATAQAQVVVIISTKNPISKLTADQVSQIFLGQAKTFYTGAMCEPLDQAEGSGARNEFYQKVTGKNAAQLRAHWSKLTFSGKAQPPQALAGNQAVVKMVADNPKFIGYVDKSAVDGSVKVVLAP